MTTKSFLLKQFLFIPMLTPNDSTWEGELRDFKNTDPGFKNENLRKNYLNPAHNISKGQRDFRKIAKYFSDEKIKSEIYDNKDEKYFTEDGREKYFNNITDDYFQKASLIFLDPDKGMEIKNSSDKHVLYSNIKALYKKAKHNRNSLSILMIIQFFPREKHATYIEKRLKDLRTKVTRGLAYITDNQVIFFFLTNKNRQIENLQMLFAEYKKEYPKCYFG